METTVHSFKLLRSCLAAAAATAILAAGCDDRSASPPSDTQPSFSGDINIVRDFERREVIARFTFYRDGDTIPHGVVRLNDTSLTAQAGGVYALRAPLEAVFDGLNLIEFTSPRDNYDRTLSIRLPDSFAVANISPRDNRGVNDVTVEWSRPTEATKVILVVVARNYPQNGSLPYMAILDDEVTNHVVPYTIFEDEFGSVIRDVYYVRLAAFNQGFGSYEDIEFPLPLGLPRQRLTNPSGFATYGTVAPADSILVLP